MASKHAVEGLSKSAALDGATDRVRVLTLQPHATESDMLARFAGIDLESPMRQALRASVPLGRFAGPEEQASALLYMCSDEASFMTGSALALDGGFLAR
jgi:NAD(P)-dependent dehydrogenase (short-subunit alcohol dehydrogenase family)